MYALCTKIKAYILQFYSNHLSVAESLNTNCTMSMYYDSTTTTHYNSSPFCKWGDWQAYSNFDSRY